MVLVGCSRPTPPPVGPAQATPPVADVAVKERPGGLTKKEQAIVAAVERGNDAALALLERVVNINSGTLNVAGVKAVGQIFATQLDALGFKTRWIDGAPFGRAGRRWPSASRTAMAIRRPRSSAAAALRDGPCR